MRKKMWHFSKKTITVSIRIIETLVAFLIVVGGLAFWKLYTEPVQIESMLPTLAEHLIPSEAGLTVQADSVLLGAGGQGKGLVSISVRELTITRTDGSVVTQLPEVEMSYSFWDIITLDYVPSSLTFKKPLVQMIVDENGHLYIQNEASAPIPKDVQKRSSKETLKILDAIIRYLLSFRELSFEEAKIVIDDRQLGEKVSMPVVNMRLSRELGFNHALSAKASVLVEEDLMNVTMQARLNRKNRKMDFKVEFEDVSLNRIGRVLPFLTKADLVVDGQLSGSFDFRHPAKSWNQYFEGGAFQIKTVNKGNLNLPEPLTNEYHIQKALIRGAIGEDLKRIKIAQSSVVLEEGVTANVEVTVDEMDTFFKTGDVAQIKTVLKSDIQNVPMDLVPFVWPSALGTTAHTWVRENLSGGKSQKALFTLYFTGGELVDLFGDMTVEDVQVRYLSEMTPVENVGGQVLLYPDRVRILANKGSVGLLQLQKADVDLRNLLDPVSEARINLSVVGPVKEAMQLIAEKPLEFPQMFGILPEQTNGTAKVDVELVFPLIEGLEKNQVKVDVKAHIVDGVFETPIPQISIKQASLDLQVDNKGLHVAGKGMLAEVPVDLIWDESFLAEKESDVRSHYRINGKPTDEQLIQVYPDLNGWFAGTIATDADIKIMADSVVKGTLTLDTMGAETFLYPISVMKPAGVPMNLTGDVVYHPKNKELNIQFDLDGYADLGQQEPVKIKGALQKGMGINVELKQVIAPGTSFNGYFKYNGADDIDIFLNGEKWDMTAWSERPKTETEIEDKIEQKEEKTPIPNVQNSPPSVTVDIQMERLVVVPEKPLKSIRVLGKRSGYFWQDLNASMKAGGDIQLSFNPETKKIKASVDNLGNLLAYTDLSDRIVGGRLTLEGNQPVSGGFTGIISVGDFSFKDPGFFVQAVTILGIVDAIRGQDMVFKKAEIPFEITPYQTVYLKDGYAFGTTLGLTIKGRIRPKELDLLGSVIPAYAINSLPGKIPFIGALFKDGTGGGLVGVKYDIKGAPTKPKVTFNPLGSLAPGILGNLFK